MVKFYISIDVGKQGGLCFRSSRGDFSLHKMPLVKNEVNFAEVYKLLAFFKGKNVRVGFEKLQGIFGTSKKATWSLAEQVGHFKAFCIALKLPYTEIPAKEWQAEIFSSVKNVKRAGKGGKDKTEIVNDTKAVAYFAFLKLYPKIKVPKGERGRILDGQIDAALICQYLIQTSK